MLYTIAYTLLESLRGNGFLVNRCSQALRAAGARCLNGPCQAWVAGDTRHGGQGQQLQWRRKMN